MEDAADHLVRHVLPRVPVPSTLTTHGKAPVWVNLLSMAVAFSPVWGVAHTRRSGAALSWKTTIPAIAIPT